MDNLSSETPSTEELPTPTPEAPSTAEAMPYSQEIQTVVDAVNAVLAQKLSSADTKKQLGLDQQ